MDSVPFKKKLEPELEKLTKEQLVHFAWLCAVRALPFLGCEGNFYFWEKNEMQKHLYAVFYALDVSAAFSFLTPISGAVANRAADAANDAAPFPTPYAAVIATANSAAAAAEVIAANSVTDAANAAHAADAACTSATNSSFDFKPIILSDLENIRNQQKNSQANQTNLYVKIWDNFQKALEAEGCGYWGRLYKNIFDNGFELDQEALERRMSVPEEIRVQGAAAVARYLEELEKGTERLNEARIIILGDKGAGKTCLARRLVDPAATMTEERESTAGVDTTLWKLEKENINVHIWDFAGHVVTHAVHQFFLSERCLYVIVYDGRTEERNRLEYWLNHMKNYGGDSKAMVLVNKRDEHSVDIPINSLKEEYPIEGLYTFSIRDDKKEMQDFRQHVVEFIRNNTSWNTLLIPASYYKVKKELEDYFTRGETKKCTEHITRKEFDIIASANNVENTEGLLKDLHSLGVSLWYREMVEFDTLVLNPEWISHGVYRIINWASEEKKYSLTLQDFAAVFKEDAIRYPANKHGFLFKLMIHYELAYETDGESRLIIPHLLKEDRPAELPDFPVGDSLMLRYKAEQPLPPNTITRFIVRHNREIKTAGKEYPVWRYGVILENGKGAIALVREENRTISVSVKGTGKTAYISTLRETLNDIFSSYKSKKPVLQYRIERFGPIPDELETRNPLWLPDSKIFTHSVDKVPYYDDQARQPIDLRYTVTNYNITAQTLISGQGNQFLDKSVHNTFNFQDCSISLQGSLNELARSVAKAGNSEDALELKTAAGALEEAEQCKTPEEVKKKGIAGRLKRLAEDLGDEKSTLHKTVEGIKHGIGIAQDIAGGYNDLAQWLGWPQVPRPFLKKKDKD